MINYFCLFCYCCLNLLLFSTLVSSESLNNNRQQSHDLNRKQITYLADSELTSQEDSENNINTEPSVNTRNEGNFIAGLWRGFHESEGLMIYYGYQFRPDGRFVARHRIYQERETLEDITWQGEWQFRDNTLILKAFNSKDKTQQATFELKLTHTFKLAYETGSLADAYQMMLLNKIGQL